MAGPETVTASGLVLLHLLYLIFQHTLDLVAHGLRAGLAEMNPHDIGSAAYLFHQGLAPDCGGMVLIALAGRCHIFGQPLHIAFPQVRQLPFQF